MVDLDNASTVLGGRPRHTRCFSGVTSSCCAEFENHDAGEFEVQPPDRREPRQQERGFAMVLFLVLVTFGSFTVLALYELQSTRARADRELNTKIDHYYETESALHSAVAWLSERSEEMVSVFLRDAFYENFDRSAPSIGSNDSGNPGIPTQIKRKSGADSVILTNDTALGTSNFPLTTYNQSMSFDPNADFAAQDFSDISIKITLVDAIASQPAKDFGDHPAPLPGTDFYPVFRIDALSPAKDTHLYFYVVGQLESADRFGFYGKDFVEVGQDCDSFSSENGSYNPLTPNANCEIASAGPICIRNNTKVFGSVSTQGVLESGGACKGKICADSACSEEGPTCQGADCKPFAYPEYTPYEEVCPLAAEQPAEVFVDATKHVAGAQPAQKCWAGWKATGTVTLTSTAHPYYVRRLEMGNIVLAPDDPEGIVTIVTKEIVGNSISGFQRVNAAGRPSQLQIVYLGSNNLQILGSTILNMQLIAPYVQVELSGNTIYSGGVLARSLKLNGNVRLHHDESAANDLATDIQYRVRQLNQYR